MSTSFEQRTPIASEVDGLSDSVAMATPSDGLDALAQAVLHTGHPRPIRGRLVRAVGTVLRAAMTEARVGDLCRLDDRGLAQPLMAEVVGLDGDEAILAPIGDVRGVSAGAAVTATRDVLRVPVGQAVLGRVLDGLGRPLDAVSRGPLDDNCTMRPCDAQPPAALDRALVDRPLQLGLRAVDGLLTCGEGQRIGIYGEPGGGKSTLLAQLVRGAAVDVVVVGLIGERGREVRDFIEHQISAETRRRTVLVVATSDRPAVERMKAAMTATAIAEGFRDEGLRVLLLMDSVTRYARALREIGLAAGEPPTRRGFPPSVMAELPRLMERAGPAARGSITAFYTVLFEGDGAGDPIAEETRGILDGHIMLSPKLAASGHYPAIDVLTSRSRVMDAVVSREHRAHSRRLRDLLSRHAEIEFLVQVGEYRQGVDPMNDLALQRIEPIRRFLRQASDEYTPFPEMLNHLAQLAA
ncbi:FliI/YscN family ATPase [Bradyrhizobium sp. Tv2a-2]|uniref:FliI/YscN family ATPase n=1 Tax=Bradyrhizobium sp. Tv2a-2 TaxID=113395 RepID=UPI0004045ADE|nr:FliI/YscN family ATPase [Bradyrhizobium sp. Tv2a-2]